MEKIPVIIDCDPGHDDMMALVLAYGSHALDIRAHMHKICGEQRRCDLYHKCILPICTYSIVSLCTGVGKQNSARFAGYTPKLYDFANFLYFNMLC